MHKNKKQATIIYIFIAAVIIMFLFTPLGKLFIYSIENENGGMFDNYSAILRDKEIITAVINSIKISFITALITTMLAFLLAYSVNCTGISKKTKKVIHIGILVPMLLPTITYGFAIIYSLGKQGLITKLFNREIIHIYGFNGLLIGYVIYTLPMAFLLINNSFDYIDKKYILVSKLMQDNFFRGFINTILRPLLGTIAGAFLISFILTFTDFGIPASIGGKYKVISTYLYQVMLGSIPDFNKGSVIAVVMLIPALVGVVLLKYLERYNFHYDKINKSQLIKNRKRDVILAVISILIIVMITSIFVVMFITPFVENYPYNMTFTTRYFTKTIMSNTVIGVFKNSILVAGLTAIIGTIVTYVSAIINTRSDIDKKLKSTIDFTAMVTNSVPGMVLGLAYLFLFNGSDLKGTFAIIILCNIIHFFTTPYLMAKNALSKMNPNWEVTGELMGDTWFKTIIRVVIPNSLTTIIEMISYLFINSMITISAVIFLVTAKTSLLTSKIKELQHYANFNEVFILSILIFITNITFKILSKIFEDKYIRVNK
ncbi:phosphonate ABC transporter permease [Vallitalea longa]|uniref:Phosphonate ABC transporter permease n=1 Tax=Vallitalea longa TaxID=2936439 RepID=A0A9W5YAI5_9FIRM|nr:ABC transporter permease subunit [Vallitalea longa]GKX27733.1 phosphonate ABC transporter permease [Vallitalea longa]